MIPQNAKTPSGPHYSDLNSTTVALGSGETFTGEWEDVQAFNDIIIAVATDTDGYYYIQFSPDSENVDSSLFRHHGSDEINVPHRFTITRRWVRVVYTNGSNAQTYLRIQTSYGNRHPLNAPLDGTLAQDYDAYAVRPSDYHYEVALGLRQGNRTFNKFGYNPDIDTGGFETIWPVGGLYAPPTTAYTLNISSDSLEDDGGGSFLTPQGTGAAGVQLVGLDANRKTQTEFVALDGTATVTTTSTWLGINRAAAVYAGSAQSNVGNITISHTTGGQVLGYIPAGDSVTQQMIYHTQNQARGLVDWLYLNFDKASGGGNPTVNVRMRIFNPLTNIYFLVYESVFDTSVTQIVQLNPQQPFQTSAGDVLLLEASTSANNTVLYGRFSLIEVQDADYNPSI